MNFNKIFKTIILCFVLNSCTTYSLDNNIQVIKKNNFVNQGFTLVYSEKKHNDKIIKNKMDLRSLIIFQKNLKPGSSVIIKNIISGKQIIAKVGKGKDYPNFYNSVITPRISKDLNLDLNEPYIEVSEILDNYSFVAKKAKTFDEEKNVANKAPIESININNLNKKIIINKKKEQIFNYNIKIADFYFKDTAKLMVDRIKSETKTKKVSIITLSKTRYRVIIGPFFDIITLQKVFNDINILQFENIEITKNE